MPMDKVSVSVIMPIRNEAMFIERSLGSVLSQDYPAKKLEVLVVDGMSDDDTRNKVANIAACHPEISVMLLDNPHRYMPMAFNVGLQKASGDVIIVIGGHCEISPNYVSQCVKALETTGAQCVGGPMHTIGETTTARGIALALSSRFGVGGVAFRTDSQAGRFVDTVAFGAYRREVFEQIGHFDEEMIRNQDDEFNFRLTQAGGRIWLDPAIRSTYYSRTSLRRLWRQYFEYGLYKVRLIQKRGAVPSWRHLVPASFVLALISSFVLGLTLGNPTLQWSVLLPYFFANAAASIWTARSDWNTLAFLPISFFVLHAAYGIGFLYGLWRWRVYFLHEPTPAKVI